jgi:hypothetical protein
MSEKEMTDYTKVKWWPWWKQSILTRPAGAWAIPTLKKGQTKFLTRRDKLGMIQLILKGVDDGTFR